MVPSHLHKYVARVPQFGHWDKAGKINAHSGILIHPQTTVIFYFINTERLRHKLVPCYRTLIFLQYVENIFVKPHTSCLLPPTFRITGPEQEIVKNTSNKTQILRLFLGCATLYYIILYSHLRGTCLPLWGRVTEAAAVRHSDSGHRTLSA